MPEQAIPMGAGAAPGATPPQQPTQQAPMQPPTPPSGQQAPAAPTEQGGGAGIPSIEFLADKFQQLAESSPEMAQEVAANARESGLAGEMLEEIGILAVQALIRPDSYPQVRQIMIQRYPNEAQVLPETYQEAEEILFEIAFAAFLQDGGQI